MRRALLLSIWILILGCSHFASAQEIEVIGAKLNKNAVPNILELDGTIGTQVLDTITLINKTDTNIFITIQCSPAQLFVCMQPIPTVIPKGDSIHIVVAFSPSKADTQRGALTIIDTVGNGQSTTIISLLGTGLNTIPANFFPPVRFDFNGVMANSTSCATLTLHVTGQRSVTIAKIAIEGDPSHEFTIDSGYTKIIQPGATASITTCYTPKSSSTSGYIVYTWKGDGDSIKTASTFLTGYLIEGVSGVHQTLNTSAVVAISPNPSRGMFSIEIPGARNTTFEIIDMLGHTIQSFEGDNHWSCSNMRRTGTYFVRMRGVYSSGEPFLTTRRIVVE